MLSNTNNIPSDKDKHDFVINDGDTKTFISINYDKKTIDKFMQRINNKNETTIYNEHTVFNMVPIRIFESYNILNPDEKPRLSLSFHRNGSPQVQTITSDNISNINSSLEHRSGIVLSKNESKDTLNHIIREYEKLGLLEAVEEIPVAGIFINPKTGKLVRSDENGEVKIEKPSKKAVQKALDVWYDLYGVYPKDSEKLSHILRHGLLSPFSYIFKTEHEYLRFLFLYGAAKTAKTTLAEISLSPYVTIDENISIGGGSFDTPYRIGHTLEHQGFGVIVNEPGAMLQNGDCIEIIKRSTESPISREKWDNQEHVKIPAFSNIIFTSNAHLPTEDSLIRRGDIIEFTNADRLNEDDYDSFKDTFNHTDKSSNRFRDLRPIGDYIIWYVSQNLDILSKPKKEIVDSWIDELLDYADDNRDWSWIYQETELMEIQEADDELKSIFINTLNEDYKRSGVLSLYNDNDLEKSKETFKDNWKRIIQSKYVIYAELHNDGKHVFINSQIKNRVKERTGKTVSCKSFASILGAEYKNYTVNKKTKKGFRLEIDDFADLFY